MRHICLVSCVSKKLDHPAPAKDLYISEWFRKARAYAETFGEWYILSAKHHLLKPGETVEPYDQSLLKSSKTERMEWMREVYFKLQQAGYHKEATILAGRRYTEFLVPELESHGYKVNTPLAGLGIGQQLQWLKERVETMNALHEPFCYELTVNDKFDAAHSVEIPLSPCANLHGHTWEVTTYVKTACCGANGISLDFREIRTALRAICNSLDHTNLNEALPFPATAELIAKHICTEMGKELDSLGVKVDRVTVREGIGAVTYTAG